VPPPGHRVTQRSALEAGTRPAEPCGRSAVAVLDLLIDQEHDKIADVDVARPCQHVQHSIGHIFRRQPSSGGDAIGDRRAVCDLPKIIQHDAWRNRPDSNAGSDQLPPKGARGELAGHRLSQPRSRVDGNGALHGRTAAVTAINTVGAGDAFMAGYFAAVANASLPPTDRLASALRWGATAVQHQGTLLSRVDDRIPVHVTAADPNVVLSEPATP
jgi:hypothetical protein